jgi:hypothetical protein
LETDKKAVNQTHAARLSGTRGRGLTTCPECSAVRMESDPCGSCGWRLQAKPRYVEFTEGDLGQVSRDRSVHVLDQDEIAFHRQLVAIAQEKSRKRGWVAHTYRAKYGRFPRGSVSPMPPTPEVRAWVRSRDIAYARACDKAMGTRR